MVLDGGKKTYRFFRVSSEDHDLGDGVKKKVEAPSDFLWLSSDSFSWTAKRWCAVFLNCAKVLITLWIHPLYFSKS